MLLYMCVCVCVIVCMCFFYGKYPVNHNPHKWQNFIFLKSRKWIFMEIL